MLTELVKRRAMGAYEVEGWNNDVNLLRRLGAAALREVCIRAGWIKPATNRERRWAEEGPRPELQLDSRHPKS